ncbi:MAG: dienelactone hydrolase family protein [bacterium]
MATLQTLHDHNRAIRYYDIPAPTAGAPVVLLMPEWWGVNEQIKKQGTRLAASGFNVVILDLYDGKLARSADEASTMMQHLNWEQATHDVGALTKSFTATGAKVGITGFCLGGAVTLMAAAQVPALSAAVCFYGMPSPEKADLSQIRIPVQGHFASEDGWITPALVDKLDATLTAAGTPHEFHRYVAQHAFMNEARPEVYQPEIARVATERMVAFFTEHLG